MANIHEDFDLFDDDLKIKIVADGLDQLANQATFWSRDRIAAYARTLRNKLRGEANDDQLGITHRAFLALVAQVDDLKRTNFKLTRKVEHCNGMISEYRIIMAEKEVEIDALKEQLKNAS